MVLMLLTNGPIQLVSLLIGKSLAKESAKKTTRLLRRLNHQKNQKLKIMSKEKLITYLLCGICCIIIWAVLITVLVVLRWKFNAFAGGILIMAWTGTCDIVKRQVHKYFVHKRNYANYQTKRRQKLLDCQAGARCEDIPKHQAGHHGTLHPSRARQQGHHGLLCGQKAEHEGQDRRILLPHSRRRLMVRHAAFTLNIHTGLGR